MGEDAEIGSDFDTGPLCPHEGGAEALKEGSADEPCAGHLSRDLAQYPASERSLVTKWRTPNRTRGPLGTYLVHQLIGVTTTMVRYVFFSFHYDRDHWRANQVRNSWVTQEREVAGFVDSAEWEQIKRRGDSAIERWIKEQISGTSVTVVLIGAETSERRWVDFEIKESARKGNGFLGVRVHSLKDKDGRTDTRGPNPLSKFEYSDTEEPLTDVYHTYDWKADNGYQNIGTWIEEAARITERR